jgi:carbon storage regulator CsrA
MLVLTRRPGQEIVVAGSIRTTVTAVLRDPVRLGITAPESIRIGRAGVHERRAVSGTLNTLTRGNPQGPCGSRRYHDAPPSGWV